MTGDLVEEAEFKMKARTWILFFFGYIGMTEQAGPLGNNTGTTRVGEFRDF